MAIDGIGKSPISGAPGSADLTGISKTNSETEFAIKTAERPASAQSIDGTLVDRLHAGQLTRDEYLDLRADEAVRHLVGQIPADKVNLIRATLREQLDTDPLLMAMARRATSVHGER